MVCGCVWFDWLDIVCVGGSVCVCVGWWAGGGVLPRPSTCVAVSLNLCCHVPQLVGISRTHQPSIQPTRQTTIARPTINHPSSNKPPDRCEPQSSSTPPPLPHLMMPPPVVLVGKGAVVAAGLSICRVTQTTFCPAQMEAACMLAYRRHLAAKAQHAHRAAARTARVFRSTLRACHRVCEVYGTSSTRWCRALRDGGDELYELGEQSSTAWILCETYGSSTR